MRILFLTQYCKPEIGPAQERIFSQAKYLAEKGHKVTILTGFPNYPKGEIYAGYKQRLLKKECLDGIKVIRTLSFISKRKGPMFRMLSHLTFSLSSLLGLFVVWNIDIVMVESPPFTLGYSGYIIAKIKRAAFVYHVSDLWVDAAIALNAISKDSLLSKILVFLDRLICKLADRLITITKGCGEHLASKGITTDKIEVITNGVNTELFRPMNDVSQIRKQLEFNNEFIVIYAGTMGYMHAVETLIYAADILQEHRDILFVFVGDGIAKKDIRTIAVDLNLNNSLFLVSMKPEQLALYINAADVGVATLRNSPFSKSALSVKTFSYMACQIPVIISGYGNTADMVNEAEAGICVAPENPKQLAKAIMTLYKDRQLSNRYAMNGKDFVFKNYVRNTLDEKLETVLQSVCRRRKKC